MSESLFAVKTFSIAAAIRTEARGTTLRPRGRTRLTSKTIAMASQKRSGKLVHKHSTLKQSTHNEIKTTIYVKSSTPFVSGLKRCKRFLASLEKRKQHPSQQCVTLLGMGKATEKTLALACYFQQEKGLRVEVRTKSIEVVDEVAEDEDDETVDPRDRETLLKKREISGGEAKVYPQK